jgi:uncharacterized surface protein with fasciclin (FAS1) repeats
VFGGCFVKIKKICLTALPPNKLQELKTNKEKARSFVLYHATQGRITSDQISDNQVGI